MKPLLMISALLIGMIGFATEIEPNANLEYELLKRDKKKRTNLRQDRPVGINISAFGPGGMASASLDGFLTPKFALEGGAGLRNTDGDVSYFLGGRYHFFGGTKLKMTPYVGAYTAFHNNGRDVQNHAVYLPLGIHRVKNTGFNWSAEIAYERNMFENNNLSGAFKIGYRF